MDIFELFVSYLRYRVAIYLAMVLVALTSVHTTLSLREGEVTV